MLSWATGLLTLLETITEAPDWHCTQHVAFLMILNCSQTVHSYWSKHGRDLILVSWMAEYIKSKSSGARPAKGITNKITSKQGVVGLEKSLATCIWVLNRWWPTEWWCWLSKICLCTVLLALMSVLNSEISKIRGMTSHYLFQHNTKWSARAITRAL